MWRRRGDKHRAGSGGAQSDLTSSPSAHGIPSDHTSSPSEHQSSLPGLGRRIMQPVAECWHSDNGHIGHIDISDDALSPPSPPPPLVPLPPPAPRPQLPPPPPAAESPCVTPRFMCVLNHALSAPGETHARCMLHVCNLCVLYACMQARLPSR